MPPRTYKGMTDEMYIAEIPKIGVHAFAKKYDLHLSGVNKRRRHIEDKYKISLVSPNRFATPPKEQHPSRIQLHIKNGQVLVGSDAHYWPREPSIAHRAFVKMVKEVKPVAVIQNGDVMDFASISRHPPIGWESIPDVKDEIEAAQDRMHEIEKAAGKSRKIWTLGNHDSRFESRLALVAREYKKVEGIHLRDHFPLWEPCWSCWINDEVVIKHRFKGGIHATHNNTIWAGKTVITGHLHSLKVTPFSDYNGTRYGVDTGCLADPSGPQFLDYTEDNAKNWRSGFVLLTFADGHLLWPEIIAVSHVKPDHVEFRGKLIKV